MLKTQLPLLITFLVGLVTLADFFLKANWIDLMGSRLNNWAIVLSSVAMILGIINMIHVQAKKIRIRKAEWYNGVVMLAFMATVAIPGVFLSDKHPIIEFFFEYVISPLNATIFSLLSFFMASAAYRAFRARSAEATLLLIVAVWVMFARIPFSYFISPAIADSAQWILTYPAMAAMRGIIIGSALGVISTSLRILLGIDRSYIGSG